MVKLILQWDGSFTSSISVITEVLLLEVKPLNKSLLAERKRVESRREDISTAFARWFELSTVMVIRHSHTLQHSQNHARGRSCTNGLGFLRRRAGCGVCEGENQVLAVRYSRHNHTPGSLVCGVLWSSRRMNGCVIASGLQIKDGSEWCLVCRCGLGSHDHRRFAERWSLSDCKISGSFYKNS